MSVLWWLSAEKATFLLRTPHRDEIVAIMRIPIVDALPVLIVTVGVL
jgi:hypothetical protein